MGAAEIASLIAAVGGFASAASSAAGSGLTGANAYEAYIYNKQKQEQAIQINKDRYEQARIDSLNAMQNKVLDLKRAGLSPVLAAGGTGSPVTTMAPHSPTQLNPPEVKIPDLSSLTSTPALIMNMLKQKQDISMSNKQMQLIEEQMKVAKSQVIKNQTEAYKTSVEAQQAEHDKKINEKAGTPNKGGSYAGTNLRDITSILDTSVQNIKQDWQNKVNRSVDGVKYLYNQGEQFFKKFK